MLVSVVLAGCGAGGTDAADVRVTGKFGERPVVQPQGEQPKKPQVDMVSTGSGRVVKQGEIVIADIEIRVWKGNREYLSTYSGAGHPNSVIMDGTHVSRTWDQALVGKKIGSRVVLSSPASEGFGPSHLPPSGTTQKDALIVVFDILGSYNPDVAADGKKTKDASEQDTSLPTVSVDSSGIPRIKFPDGPAVKSATARTLLEGEGRKVTAGDTVIVQFVHQEWKAENPDQTSYQPHAPRAFDLDGEGVPESWKKFVVGASVGSRLVIAEPGNPSNADDPGGAFVIDIVDVVRKADQK
ncbi:FKBP-type peptidyl-prolyl cis-trans isomerase [Streptomyces pathocidini]|uniref:FKBP-type peptidyl-prolyl cis-trans isomerase n=1 Tax=Streptomyces pathocidini TaxID=1650571 RepID=UPI0033D04EF3